MAGQAFDYIRWQELSIGLPLELMTQIVSSGRFRRRAQAALGLQLLSVSARSARTPVATGDA
ncbi:DUF6245 family protein [Streptomyces violascens]|uniref:DUF6245 family protein n=1 Tax=Streptomyces violascens TaxID=67381 RepID=UPI0036C7F84A